MARGTDRRPGPAWLPPLYFATAVVMVVAVLPTTLRPPPEETSQTAELSPDAPPDEDAETIIQSLRQAGSHTAGATGVDDAATTTVPPTTVPAPPPSLAPPRGQCFGDPPRQDESVYAGPCVPAWTGVDNGGATARGVTGDEIRIGVMMDITGAGPDGRYEDETDGDARTWELLGEYMNRHFELYGRRLVLFNIEEPGDDEDTEQRERCRRAAEDIGVFAVIHEYGRAMADECSKRGIIVLTRGHYVRRIHAERAPYLWTTWLDVDDAAEFGAEHLCKRLAGRTPYQTGDALIDYGSPRTFGAILYNDPFVIGAQERFVRLVREQCGVVIDPVVRYEFAQAEAISTAVATLRAANGGRGVSTVIYLGELFSAAVYSQLFDQQRYYPEIYLPAYGGFEASMFITRLYNPTVWRNAFGISLWEIPRRFADLECRRALRSMDPDFSPNRATCELAYQSLVQLSSAIQLAGPELTPETFTAALTDPSLCRSEPEPVWAITGCFRSDDWSYSDSAVELWWDPLAVHADGQRGAYLYPTPVQRWKLGQLTEGPPGYYGPGTNGADLPQN